MGSYKVAHVSIILWAVWAQAMAMTNSPAIGRDLLADESRQALLRTTLSVLPCAARGCSSCSGLGRCRRAGEHVVPDLMSGAERERTGLSVNLQWRTAEAIMHDCDEHWWRRRAIISPECEYVQTHSLVTLTYHTGMNPQCRVCS